MRWVLVLAAVLGGGALILLGTVPAPYVLAPLLGLAIWKLGASTFRSLARPAAHIPDGDPRPVDVATERISYWCENCGAEMLLLVRGAETPPRHCGERMLERHEIARDAPR